MLPHSRLILLLLGLLGASATLLAAERSTRPAPVTPIPSLDVPRYMGAWYEIAKFPNRFQRQCAGYTTAHYSLQPDKTVQVINSIDFYEALMRHHVPAEMHLYPTGGHGFGLWNHTTKDQWPDRLKNWLVSGGWL